MFVQLCGIILSVFIPVFASEIFLVLLKSKSTVIFLAGDVLFREHDSES